jgi:hypothetical protein
LEQKRYFASGEEGVRSNRHISSNYTKDEAVIQSGSRSGTANLGGQNKIIT